MADSAGMDAIRAAAAKKRNVGGEVAKRLSGGNLRGANSPDGSKAGSNSGAPSNAIARRLAKGSSKSGPTKPNDHDGDEQESGY